MQQTTLPNCYDQLLIQKSVKLVLSSYAHQYYSNSFLIDQELEDDNMFGLSFPDKVHVPSSLPSLTTETYETFVNQHDSCLVAFYLQCKFSTMLYIGSF